MPWPVFARQGSQVEQWLVPASRGWAGLAAARQEGPPGGAPRRATNSKENRKVVAIELTTEQSIQILEKAKELLGPNGEHWNKGCWFAREATLEEDGFVTYRGEQGHLEEVCELPTEDADQATTWCIMGAVEEAAYRLGIFGERDASDRLAKPISLQNLVNSKQEWATWSVIDVNDDSRTTFADVKGLIDARLAELRA